MNTFELIVNDYEFDGNKLSLELKGKEKLIANYYVNDYDELINLKDMIKYGIKVRVEGELKEPSKNTVPYAFNYQKYLNNKNIYYILNIKKIEKIKDENLFYRIKNIINERINKIDNTGYLEAFILGNKDMIDSNTYNNYQKIGITHLFALSGMHIGLLSGLLLKGLKKFKESKKYLIIFIILLLYGLMVGLPYSIFRCIIFLGINYLCKIFKINISSFKKLLLTIIVICLIDSKAIYDVGFIYSVCTVGGIILCESYLKSDNKLIGLFKLSLVAFLFSLPISLSNFYEINLLSIIFNMFYVPLVSLIIYPLSLLSFIIPLVYPLFKLFIKILEVSSSLLVNIKIFRICLSFNIGEVLLYYLGLIIGFKLSKYYFIYISLSIIVIDLLLPYFDSSSYLYFIDVGQGDSALLITPYHKEFILIDTGGINSYVKEEWMKRKDEYYVSDNSLSLFKALGIKKLDYLILSHGDFDHMGDANNIIDNIKVDKVIFNKGLDNELESNLIDKLKEMNIKYDKDLSYIKLNNNIMYFLNTINYDNENDNSNVLYINIYNNKLLFMGDASLDKEYDLINKYKLDKIDILKVGHHGSKTSSSKEFIDKINPLYAVISVGKNNRYGHPNKETLSNLSKSIIYRTDNDGSVMFKLKKNKLEIKTYN